MRNRFESWVALVALIKLAPFDVLERQAEPLPGRIAPISRRTVAVCFGGLAALLLVVGEMRYSHLQAFLFSTLAERMTFHTAPGPSDSMGRAPDGPYDRRLGYFDSEAMRAAAEQADFETRRQARWSPAMRIWSGRGVFPVYDEKSQAGLLLLDRNGLPLYTGVPTRAYASYEEIPSLVVNSLLFIENREMLDRTRPYRNPAVEWDRLAKAGADLAINSAVRSHAVSGGSTLATQLEKVRHSPEGRTSGLGDKLRQMATASLRAYQDGPETNAARERIVVQYVNSIPLAAIAGHGEVVGLGDGLWAWFGGDFEGVNRLLAADGRDLSPELRTARARAYRQTLTLLLALRRPSELIIQRPEELQARTEAYLRLLASEGLISAELRDLALANPPRFLPRAPASPLRRFADRKATDAVRTRLASLLEARDLYALDRLDLVAESTLDRRAVTQAAAFLDGLSDAEKADRAGLLGRQLLQGGDPARVVYSFTLYERGVAGNRLLVQADTLDGMLNVNDGTLLELGSTAKLRTLVSYLQTVEELHGRLANLSASELRSLSASDPLTQWAAAHMQSAQDVGLQALLEAAMQKTYSASPYETFFTGGGVHRFSNFDSKDNSRILTVSEAFERSVNLVFIRMMRDVVRYHVENRAARQPEVFADPASAARRRYLERFADIEGSHFQSEFFEQYKRRSPGESLHDLAQRARGSLTRLAVVYRSARPAAGRDSFADFLQRYAGRDVSDDAVDELFGKYGPDKFNLADRGYLAGVHPLELWVAEFLARRPDASWEEAADLSAADRQDVYQWLFRTRNRHAQDKRIRIVMEVDAFERIHRDWQRLGYPFDSLVPSYATAIGSSGDRPDALAELIGIIVSDGVRRPSIRVSALHFAERTPYETRLERSSPVRGEPVMHPAIARLLRQALVSVVENGTGRRAHGSVTLADGTPLTIGGKTGTGDNRIVTFSLGGNVIESRALNRTGTFVFFIGDRFYGVVTAFVPGQSAAEYRFTSALPVQVFKGLIPTFQHLLDEPPAARTAPVERFRGPKAPLPDA